VFQFKSLSCQADSFIRLRLYCKLKDGTIFIDRPLPTAK